MPKKLSHLDESGKVRMVDVGDKDATARHAVAEGWLIVGADIIETLERGESPKGNVYETARIAGIQGAKRTSELIPLCHQLPLDHVAIDFEVGSDRIRIVASARTHSSTGVEMEALTAAAVAGLTLYDMLKALSHEMTFTGLRLLQKSGGRSGTYRADDSVRT